MITTFNNWCRSILSHRIVRKKAARSIGVSIVLLNDFIDIFIFYLVIALTDLK